MTSSESQPRTAATDADYKHANIVGLDRCKCGVTWLQGGGFKGYAFHLEDVLTGLAIEAEAAAGPPASAERVTRERLAAAIHEAWPKGVPHTHQGVECRALSADAWDILAALPEAAVQEPAAQGIGPLSPEAEKYLQMRERGERPPAVRDLQQRLDDCEQALYATERAAAQPPPASVEAEGLDVELLARAFRKWVDSCGFPSLQAEVLKHHISVDYIAAEYLRLLEQREA